MQALYYVYFNLVKNIKIIQEFIFMDIANPNTKKLTEEFVKDKYNKDLINLKENYTERRWLHSVESRFDYEETKRAFLKAFGNGDFRLGLEVGPGDGVWTKEVANRIESLEILDQSEEMLVRAKEVLKSFSNISYTQANLANHEFVSSSYDIIFSVRCFEYITDKDKALRKFFSALNPGGKFVLITKNPYYKNQSGWKAPLLHTEQMGKSELISLLKKHGFEVEAVYPAVMRWKSKYAFFRILFGLIHRIILATNGKIYIPLLTDRSTESYTYIARKKKALVELYGLSGSGKSTLARELSEKEPLIKLISPQQKSKGIPSFIIKNPGTFFFWIKEMFINALLNWEWTLFRHRLSILLSTFSTFAVADNIKAGVVVLDEGLFQRVFSIYEQKRTPQQLERLIRKIPHIDLLVIVDRTEEQYVRYYNHRMNPRMKMGESYMEIWKEVIAYNDKNLKKIIKALHIPYYTVGKNDPIDNLIVKLRSL